MGATATSAPIAAIVAMPTIYTVNNPAACKAQNMPSPEQLRNLSPQLLADVLLYATDQNGRTKNAFLGWGCPCMVSNQPPWQGWDGWPLLGQQPLGPGEKRRLGFVFLSPEAPCILRDAGRFYLWEGRIVGEAIVVS